MNVVGMNWPTCASRHVACAIAAALLACTIGCQSNEQSDPRIDERARGSAGSDATVLQEQGQRDARVGLSGPADVVALATPVPAWRVPSVTPPHEMILVPGGRTTIGSNDGFPMEGPMFEVDVPPFFMDEHEVTVKEFGAFVDVTGYQTQAEKFGNSAVIDEELKQWILLDGADWRMPAGPNGDPAETDHPVTHISWNDAIAYASWAGKRLPTEIEWEHAARGASNSRSRYPPGLTIGSDGFPNSNLWQGVFPYQNTGQDGHFRTAAVGSFGKDSLGLADIAGNVWEWVDSWYRPYPERGQTFSPDEFSARVQRGGSFLCNDSWCHGFRVSARGQSTPESSHYHVGFRCVQDIPDVVIEAKKD